MKSNSFFRVANTSDSCFVARPSIDSTSCFVHLVYGYSNGLMTAFDVMLPVAPIGNDVGQALN
jgi:hypothetical protein